jgi:hypothetical protein
VSATKVPWSKTDDADLKQLIRQGRTLQEAAAILDRSVGDVEQRLRQLGSRMPGAGPQDRTL